jgi:hypothetical protein
MKKPIIIPAIFAAIITYKVGCDFQHKQIVEKPKSSVEKAVNLDSNLFKHMQIPEQMFSQNIYNVGENDLDSLMKKAEHDINLVSSVYSPDSGRTSDSVKARADTLKMHLADLITLINDRKREIDMQRLSKLENDAEKISLIDYNGIREKIYEGSLYDVMIELDNKLKDVDFKTIYCTHDSSDSTVTVSYWDNNKNLTTKIISLENKNDLLSLLEKYRNIKKNENKSINSFGTMYIPYSKFNEMKSVASNNNDYNAGNAFSSIEQVLSLNDNQFYAVKIMKDKSAKVIKTGEGFKPEEETISSDYADIFKRYFDIVSEQKEAVPSYVQPISPQPVETLEVEVSPEPEKKSFFRRLFGF